MRRWVKAERCCDSHSSLAAPIILRDSTSQLKERNAQSNSCGSVSVTSENWFLSQVIKPTLKAQHNLSALCHTLIKHPKLFTKQKQVKNTVNVSFENSDTLCPLCSCLSYWGIPGPRHTGLIYRKETCDPPSRNTHSGISKHPTSRRLSSSMWAAACWQVDLSAGRLHPPSAAGETQTWCPDVKSWFMFLCAFLLSCHRLLLFGSAFSSPVALMLDNLS